MYTILVQTHLESSSTIPLAASTIFAINFAKSRENSLKLKCLFFSKILFFKTSPNTMTTAARPTFHPAVGGEDQGYFRMEAGTRQLSVKDMPGHTRLKMRKAQVLGNNGQRRTK